MNQRDFGHDVLAALSGGFDKWTYVIRNILVMDHHHPSGLKTSRVLRECKRLEMKGLVREVRSISLVHKNWLITDAGRAALSAEKETGE